MIFSVNIDFQSWYSKQFQKATASSLDFKINAHIFFSMNLNSVIYVEIGKTKINRFKLSYTNIDALRTISDVF